MTADKRRAKRISVELPVTVYLFDKKRKLRIGEPLVGRLRDFSPLGAAMKLATIMISGKHLFYTCADNPEICLELAFELGGAPENMVTVPAVPVWFDLDRESAETHFDIGVKFLADARSPEIKKLSQEACRDEQRLISLWKKFF
ncbi:MAG: hypothetical protein ACWGN1_06560 [Desulfobulbales bacterium]